MKLPTLRNPAPWVFINDEKLADRQPRTAEWREPFYRGIIEIAKGFLTFQGLKMTIHGAENMPTEGGAMIACNHLGYFDFIYDGIPAHLHGRRLVRFMAKKEIFDHKIAGPLMRLMKHIPVDRKAGAASLEEARQRVSKGQLVGIFPEATISRSLEIKDFKNGVARIAYDAGVPIIPLVSWGSHRMWTKGGRPVWRAPGTPVIISVGKPIIPGEDPDETTAQLRETMITMLDTVREEYVHRYGPFEDGVWWMPASMGGGAKTPEEIAAEDAARKNQAKK